MGDLEEGRQLRASEPQAGMLAALAGYPIGILPGTLAAFYVRLRVRRTSLHESGVASGSTVCRATGQGGAGSDD